MWIQAERRNFIMETSFSSWMTHFYWYHWTTLTMEMMWREKKNAEHNRRKKKRVSRSSVMIICGGSTWWHHRCRIKLHAEKVAVAVKFLWVQARHKFRTTWMVSFNFFCCIRSFSISFNNISCNAILHLNNFFLHYIFLAQNFEHGEKGRYLLRVLNEILPRRSQA